MRRMALLMALLLILSPAAFAQDTPTLTPSPTLTLTPSPTGNAATPNRTAVPEAYDLYSLSDLLGLPAPFTVFPYAGADQFGQLDGAGLSIQGFGTTTFSYVNRNLLYENTSGIHTGIDFGGGFWSHETIVSVCDWSTPSLVE